MTNIFTVWRSTRFMEVINPPCLFLLGRHHPNVRLCQLQSREREVAGTGQWDCDAVHAVAQTEV